MGGETSEHFQQFKNLCFTVFILLRRLLIFNFNFFRNVNSILNMFALMLEADIVDIALDPDKAIQKVYFNKF